MAQVIDASVAVAWCAERQATPLTEAALEAVAATGGYVPSIFWFAVLHVLTGLAVRRIIPRELIDEFAAEIAQFKPLIDPAYQTDKVVELYRLARLHRLNIYDASYLELALRTGFPLATRDRSLARASSRAGVRLFKA